MITTVDEFKSETEFRSWLVAALRAQATFVPESRIGDVMLSAAVYIAALPGTDKENNQ